MCPFPATSEALELEHQSVATANASFMGKTKDRALPALR